MLFDGGSPPIIRLQVLELGLAPPSAVTQAPSPFMARLTTRTRLGPPRTLNSPVLLEHVKLTNTNDFERTRGAPSSRHRRRRLPPIAAPLLIPFLEQPRRGPYGATGRASHFQLPLVDPATAAVVRERDGVRLVRRAPSWHLAPAPQCLQAEDSR